MPEKLPTEFSEFIDKTGYNFDDINKNFEEVNKNFENTQNQLREQGIQIESQDRKLKNYQQELESHKNIHKFLLTITIGIAVAFLITSILLAFDYFNFTKETRQRFHEKLEQLEKENQNFKLDQLLNYKLDSINKLDKDS